MKTTKIQSVSEIKIGDRLILKGYTKSGFTAGATFKVTGEINGWLQLKADTHIPSRHPEYVIAGIEYRKDSFSPKDFEKIIREST
ncbi:hypothetical protein F4Z99_12705 [Candidatus Poribacteria bacterium]|nr:hypothetical protein [Candidatus Poribacteria bacterium]MYB02511.1 hypothetical protein [Candidatus Poribacteria bacterium]